MEQPSGHRPGDIILEHFVPHLTGADRELARTRLQGLARLMLKVAMREVREERGQGDSLESASRDRIELTP